MKAVVVGSGGREHALVRALGRSALVNRIYAWPGSDGIFLDAIKPPDTVKDYRSFAEWANNEKVDLVVIGPELELVEGLADQLRANGISVFGPQADRGCSSTMCGGAILRRRLYCHSLMAIGPKYLNRLPTVVFQNSSGVTRVWPVW